MIAGILHRFSFIPFIKKYIEIKRINSLFVNERLLIQGKIEKFDNIRNNSPSILHFSLNKSATQYVKSILVKIAKDSAMCPIHLHEYAFYSDFPYLNTLSPEEMNKYKKVFQKTGFAYTAFGGYIKGIENVEDYKVILVIRDPRDILVSNYYSIGISHQPPAEHSNKREYFNAKRLEARETPIDTFVLNNFQELKDNISCYIENIHVDCPQCLILKYEDMVADFPMWLTRLFDYLDRPTNSKLFQNLVEENNHMIPKKEDVTKHIRKGKAGDYLEKLAPETIEKLDVEFKDVLSYFDYTS